MVTPQTSCAFLDGLSRAFSNVRSRPAGKPKYGEEGPQVQSVFTETPLRGVKPVFRPFGEPRPQHGAGTGGGSGDPEGVPR